MANEMRQGRSGIRDADAVTGIVVHASREHAYEAAAFGVLESAADPRRGFGPRLRIISGSETDVEPFDLHPIEFRTGDRVYEEH